MKKVLCFISAFFFILVTNVASAQTQQQVCHDPRVLRLAVIPQVKNKKVNDQYDVLVDALQKALNRHVILVPVGSYSAVIEGLLNQSVDLAELGPGSYALAKERGADISVFASLHTQTDSESPAQYHSVLITDIDSDIRNFESLQGESVSLVDPISTSGGLVPRLFVERQTGMPLETWFKRVVFAGSHDLAIDAVLSGRVTAAFVSDTQLEEKDSRGHPLKKSVRVLWRSDPIPADPFVYQNGLCNSVKAAIEHVFFENPEQLQSFFAWRNRQGFIPVDHSDYQFLIR